MQIHIILCTDEHYIIPCGITIFSICYHNKQHNLHFHILAEEVSDRRKAELETMIKNSGQNICFYKIKETLLKNVPVNNCFRTSIYYRLLMANILPSNINKILYLDSDIIVRGDIEELWEYDISNYALGAVLDQSCDDIRNSNRIGLPPLSDYYNSGVLLINLDFWRKQHIGEQCIRYVKENAENVLYPDQDALNIITQHKWIKLPFQYNTQAFMFYQPSEILARIEYVRQMIKASENPLIIHYTEARKPWMYGCKHPFTSEYLKYKRLSPWCNTPLIKKKNTGRIDRILAFIKDLCIKAKITEPTPQYSNYRIFPYTSLPEYPKK